MNWVEFGKQTILDPRAAGAQLVRMHLPRDAGWSLLALLAILNGILYWALLPAEFLTAPLDGPVALTLVVGVALLLSSATLTLAGRMLGGQGDFDTLLRVTIWLQVLRLVAQIGVSLLSLALPPLAALASFAVGVWGLYIVTCLVTEAHGFSSLLRGLAVIGLSFIAAVMFLAVLLTLVGVTPQGTI
ncbi:YIP1 family protein [Pseudooceanicola aestuarii]|uniref:YIP1 family protein n=1 Tax=Pseudooceanicola aestuarii TaxID=2697319 RepID=UPI0013D12A12|nr:YIP1 family protein [Pseudooceanicola aestuarii]